MDIAVVQQRSVPAELFGPLKEFSGDLNNFADVEQAFDNDGYLCLRGALNRDDVLSARAEVFGRMHEVGEIAQPIMEGIATGASRRADVPEGLGAFWQSVSEGSALRHVTHGPALCEIMTRVLGEPARPHDMMYLRPTAVGRATALHYDYPFFAGNSLRILTAWVPLGDVEICDGPLVVVEGSHRFRDLIDPVVSVDYAADHSNDTVQAAAYEIPQASDPITLAAERGTRLLSAEFRAGDLMVFSGLTMHGSLDNHSQVNRVRLSVDVRFQPAADPADDSRYFGSNPTGSKGGGYGDMRGAKPLAE
jgi:hypothetical protein